MDKILRIAGVLFLYASSASARNRRWASFRPGTENYRNLNSKFLADGKLACAIRDPITRVTSGTNLRLSQTLYFCVAHFTKRFDGDGNTNLNILISSGRASHFFCPFGMVILKIRIHEENSFRIWMNLEYGKEKQWLHPCPVHCDLSGVHNGESLL